jgi:sugar phosphate isomerase/epimerase
MRTNLVGFVQGRLSKSPVNRLQYYPKKWDDEFKIANKLGLNFIEFFSERKFNSKNLVWSKKGVTDYKNEIKKNHLKAYTFCDDYIISNNINYSKTQKYLNQLIKQIISLNIKFLILPFYGKSYLNDKNYKSYVKSLKFITKNKRIKFLIESNISIKTFKKLEKDIKTENLFFLYDTGNRSSLNFDPEIDIIQLGKKRLKHIHIKDKDSNGTNVKLGTGKVEFKKIIRALKKIGYRGAFTFETTRLKNPIRTMKYNIEFLKDKLKSRTS